MAYVESKKVYTEQCSVIKQTKARLAELDESTGKEAGTSTKSNKSPMWLLLRPVQLTWPCKLISCLRSNRPKKPQTRPRPRVSKLPRTCSRSTQTFCQSMQSMRGTRLTTSRHHLTPTQTFKAVPRKDTGEFRASHSMTVCYSTFSSCSLTTGLSKCGTTSQMCSRSPNISAFVSLCSV
jgi:hypothetical protein